jgi:hypothetical protein
MIQGEKPSEAHHALHGKLWEKAVAYLRQAGLRAMARGASREAVSYLEQAVGTLRHLPETGRRSELAIDIHIEIRTSRFGMRSSRSAIGHACWITSKRQRFSPGRLAISTGSGGSHPTWCSRGGSLATTI